MANFEIRAKIKFLTRLNWKPVKIIEALQQIYGESAPCRAVVYDWIKRFKEEREQLEDDSREGRPSNSKNQENIKLVQNLLMKSPMQWESHMDMHFQFLLKILA